MDLISCGGFKAGRKTERSLRINRVLERLQILAVGRCDEVHVVFNEIAASKPSVRRHHVLIFDRRVNYYTAGESAMLRCVQLQLLFNFGAWLIHVALPEDRLPEASLGGR